MKTKLPLIVTLLNLALLAVLLNDRWTVAAQAVPDVVRARAWELVDSRSGARGACSGGSDRSG